MRTAAIALGEPPLIRQFSLGVHFPRGRSQWCMPEFWSVHAYRYRGRLRLGGGEHDLHPGALSLTPAGLASEYRWQGRSEHVFAHFVPGAGTPVELPLFIPARTAGDAALRLAEAAAAWPTTPDRARALLWAVLWRLAAPAAAHAGHPAVALVRARIEGDLAAPLSLPTLAEHAGCSPSQLTRLFRRELGQPVAAWIRARRLERAVHLLRATTLPVAQVGALCGIPDAQHFNKLVRAACGVGPRALRAGVVRA